MYLVLYLASGGATTPNTSGSYIDASWASVPPIQAQGFDKGHGIGVFFDLTPYVNLSAALSSKTISSCFPSWRLPVQK